MASPISTTQRKLETVGRLSAGITHEINTPMHYLGNNITFLKTAFADLMTLQQRYQQVIQETRTTGQPNPHTLQVMEAEERQLDPEYLHQEITKALDQSIEGIERVTRIVLALKDFSHPSLHEYSLADLNQCMETTVTISRHEWKRVADLEVKAEPNLPLVYCCRDDIHQALLNLIVNASHAVSAHIEHGGYDRGRVTLTSAFDDAKSLVRISVSDNGTGISPENEGKLFQSGFTTKPAGKGTGQGLVLVKQIVEERHQGTIRFTTTPGKGTCFIMELPLRPDTLLDNSLPQV